MDIKIIRALWGNYQTFIHEIPSSPLFSEVVYVWGIQNYKFLSNLGYECILISKDDFPITNQFKKYLPKLHAFVHGCNDFKEVLFLDWDTIPKKDIDNSFYKDLKGREFSSPLYCYPDGIKSIPSAVDDKDAAAWIERQIPFLDAYSWKLGNLSIVPNAGFVYLSDLAIASDLKQIAYHFNLETLVEELAMCIYSNCSLEEYILKYEPFSIRGRNNDDYFNLGPVKGYYSKVLNDHIENYIDKDIYFEHV